MTRTHFGQHGPDCFGCKLHSVQFDGQPPSPQTQMEARWARDLPAYKRLRQQGLQPPRTQGCAELEQRAHMDREVEMGRIIAPQAWAQVGPAIEEAEAIAKEGHYTIDDIRQWKQDHQCAG
jgi:hypothetical protein